MVKDRSSAISLGGHEAKAVRAVRAARREGPTFGEVSAALEATAAPSPLAGEARAERVTGTL